MFLTPEILTLFILNSIFLVFGLIAFVMSIKISMQWDINSTCQRQYRLEKQSYLTATIVKFIFMVKVPLFLFFIFTLDKMSNILPGAMCAAGVVNATDYGSALLILKVINLYLFAYWLVLNSEDLKQENMPYTKLKFKVYIVLFILFLIEIGVEAVMFGAIDVKKVVDCCGAIYSSSSNSYISYLFTLPSSLMLSLFYGNFLLIVVFYFTKNRYLFSLFNGVFAFTSISTLILFFGTYIYELPTHHCPFCFLQHDYNYVGYLLYILLFSGTFYGLVIGLIDFEQESVERYYKRSVLLNSFYLALVSYYCVSYYLKNGVWL